MRVLVVTNMYPPHAYGGYEHSCRDVAEAWHREGDEVTVLTSDHRLPGVLDADSTLPVRRQLRLYWDDHRILSPPTADRLAIDRANLRHLRATLRSVDPDVVSVWAMGAMSMGILSELAEQGRPTVLVICDEWPVYGPEVDAWLRLFVHRPRLGRLLEQVSRRHGRVTWHATLPPLDTLGPACFVSDFLRRRARQATTWRFPVSAVVYSGIDTTDFPLSAPPGNHGPAPAPDAQGALDDPSRGAPAAAPTHTAPRRTATMPRGTTPSAFAPRTSAPSAEVLASTCRSEMPPEHHAQFGASIASDLPPWQWRLLYVGRIDPRKGIDVALRALTACPGYATLAIHGTGDATYAEQLRQLADDLKIRDRVTFTATARHDLADVYRHADALLFPSTWEEPLGLVPIEAMACDLPVVACRVGGAAELLVHEANCLAVPPGDPTAMASALKRLAGDDALRRHLIAGGRMTAAQLDVARLARQLRAWHLAATALAQAHMPAEPEGETTETTQRNGTETDKAARGDGRTDNAGARAEPGRTMSDRTERGRTNTSSGRTGAQGHDRWPAELPVHLPLPADLDRDGDPSTQ